MMLPRRSSNAIPHPSRWVVRASLGLVGSTLAWWSLSTLWHSGYAQTFTAQEISNYAAAIVAMEDIRRAAYGEISDLMTIANEDVTRYDLRCLSADALKTLPRTIRSQVRRELIDYCNDAQKIVQDAGLTVQLFNSITVNHRENAELVNQIQLEIARIR
ncbi:DUF4168 domain-containing protein [Leptothoe spongobia]|nr:DUF4168 domain-containing protein [Leptothoe spongobia]